MTVFMCNVFVGSFALYRASSDIFLKAIILGTVILRYILAALLGQVFIDIERDESNGAWAALSTAVFS